MEFQKKRFTNVIQDIRREFQNEKEKMLVESEKQRNELERKLQYGEDVTVCAHFAFAVLCFRS